MQIGKIWLPANLALAPMAGVSDLAFRRICHRMGAGLTVTELVSARGLVHDPSLDRSWRFLSIDPQAGPMGIQLFGSEPADFSTAICTIMEHPVLRHCSLIDINMGCPVKKVVSAQAGSALMRDPDRAAAIVRAAVRTAGQAGKPVTVKIRSGWDASSVNAEQFACRMEEAGAAALTVHARTRDQFYSGQAEWSVIEAVCRAVTIPVFGNGDVWTADDAFRMLRQTGAAGVMVGRGAQGNPWIFRQIRESQVASDGSDRYTHQGRQPGLEERIALIIEHMDSLIQQLGERTAIKEMRRHFSWYVKGQHGAAHLRMAGMKAGTRQELLQVLEDWRNGTIKYCENS
ncbi:MAG: tRNA dihydrouridine synthase DusB [Ruminococcaceae bacterium]|nr:tRNA dihydrouridine synthase DusB [Oscillospiraceae bacterium]